MSAHPQVKWFQKDTYIGLTVEVVDAKKDTLKIELTETSINFQVEASSGKNEFCINFHKKVNPKKYSAKIKDRRIKIIIAKDEECGDEWSRLTPEKPRWLKFDIDSVDLTDEETIAARKLQDARKRLEAEHGPLPQDTKIQQISNMLNPDDLSRDIEEAEKEMWSMLRNSYLTIYNSVVWLGYFYVFCVSLLRLCIEGKGAISTNYQVMSWLLKSCQQTVFLEIFHSILGITKTPTLTVFLQVVGRAVVLFPVVDAQPELQATLACYLLVVCWSAVEVVRYPYYIVQTYELYFPKLMWARYSLWVPLYPLGILCEAYLVHSCIGYVSQTGRLSLTLPNSLNVAFCFATFLKLHLLAILLGGTSLMSYMNGQRKKAMKKLSKLKQMEDIYDKEKDLIKIRKKMETKKLK